ncbi:Uncharacterized protein Rs2_03834 [Raphanus sativus]|nr:Uncharacterized protein Rs2_03834 [Raphanus sativus]
MDLSYAETSVLKLVFVYVAMAVAVEFVVESFIALVGQVGRMKSVAAVSGRGCVLSVVRSPGVIKFGFVAMERSALSVSLEVKFIAWLAVGNTDKSRSQTLGVIGLLQAW